MSEHDDGSPASSHSGPPTAEDRTGPVAPASCPAAPPSAPGLTGEVACLHAALQAERQARLHAEHILDHITEARFSLDAECRFVATNEAAERHFGCPAAALLGRSLWDVTGVTPEAKVRQVFEQALATGEPAHTESRWLRHPDHWAVVYVFPRDGGLDVCFRDISGYKRTESVLARQAHLLEQTHEAIFVLHYPSGVIAYWNRGAAEMYGYSYREAAGKTARVLLQTANGLDAEALQEMLARSGQWHGELHQTAKDGRRVVVESRQVLITQSDGRRMVLETNHDITAQKRLQEDLRRSEEQLRLATTAADIGVWSWRPGTSEVAVSANWRQLFGVADGVEVTFETWAGCLHPDDRERAVRQLNEASEQHREFDTEYRVVWPDGTVRWLVDRGRASYDEAGTPTMMAGVNVDITARKEAEEEHERLLRQVRGAGARFEAVVEKTPACVAVWRGPDVVCDLANPAYHRIAPGKQFIGRPFADSWPEVADQFLPIVRRVMETGEPYHAVDAHVRIQRTPGGPFEDAWFDIFFTLLPADETGRTAVLNIATETTERRQQEAALRESETRLRTLADAMPQIVWTAGLDGAVDYYNEQWAAYFGSGPGEHLGWDWREVIHPDDLALTLERWTDAIATGTAYHVEYRLRRSDGVYRWHLGRAVPMKDREGRVARWFGTCTDIDSIKEAQAEIDALNVRLRRAMAETHHRVKNNLQTIAALVEMAVHAHGEAVPADAVNGLGKHVLGLASIHDLLTAQAREGAGVDSLSMRAALGKLLPMLQATLSERRVEAILDDLSIPVRQATAVTLVINELVSNAAKHASTGDIHLRLRDCTRAACLTVEDAGPGFPAGFAPEADANTGLELVLNLVRHDLRGRATFENRAEGGARVTVEFPLEG